MNLLGQPLIVLNSLRVAAEMLEKKGSIYSERPTFMMSGEIVGWKDGVSLIAYGDRLREARRSIHKFMGSKQEFSRFHSLLQLQTHKFLKRVLRSPDDVSAHIRKYVKRQSELLYPFGRVWPIIRRFTDRRGRSS